MLDPAFATDRISTTSERLHKLAKSDRLHSVNVRYSTPGGLLYPQQGNYAKVGLSGAKTQWFVCHKNSHIMFPTAEATKETFPSLLEYFAVSRT